MIVAEDTSAAYRTFLGLIGQTIVLKGWKGYRGGLNVTGTRPKGRFLPCLGPRTPLPHPTPAPNAPGSARDTDDLTGTHSVYTRWQGYEVMFHVATLLPYASTSAVQVRRATLFR